jgi:hypothetical protein
MKIHAFQRFVWVVAVLGFGLTVSACATTKATTDTISKFFSSTTPGDLFTADGLVKQDQKINLFTGVMYENLRHDIARGNGEYLTSLGTLLNVQPTEQSEFGRLVQDKYPVLFTSDLNADRTAHLRTLAVLTREWEGNRKISRTLE